MDPRTFKAIRNAIEHEKESIDMYNKLAAKLEGPAREFCFQMVIEEERHKGMLESLGAADLERMQEKLDRLGAYHIDIPFQKKDTVEELFRIARAREKASVEMYSQYARESDGDLKRFFTSMKEEEERHLELLDDAIARYKAI
ncbi:MAG: ferritin family protein [Candidatus Woesearchaeota archaeon]